MRKDRLYLYTFLSISILFVFIGGISAKYFIQLSAEQMLSIQLESVTRETKEVASLVGLEFSEGLKKNQLQEKIQETIKNSNNQYGFISVLDWSGKRIAHPDNTLIGTMASTETTSGFSMNSEISQAAFFDMVNESQPGQSNLLVLSAVPSADWIIAGHANTGKIKKQLERVENRFYTLFGLMGFAMVLGSVFTVRLIGGAYEKRLELKNENLESEIMNLAKLNQDLGNYQQKVNSDIATEEVVLEEDTTDSKDTSKKRLLTYLRNELLSVPIDDIAYIYTENTITYVVDTKGRKSTTNSSLDEINADLDPNFFFRANQQFIIGIKSLEKIIRYGNNQLKLVVQPKSELDIIIGKNKAAEFKKWLNL